MSNVNEFAFYYKRRGVRLDTPFFPDLLEGVIWFDPTDGVFVERSSPTTPSTDGQPVGTWVAVTGEVAIAPSDAARPTYRANGGKPYLEFDGTNDTLICATIDGIAEYAAGVVHAGTTANNYGSVFDTVTGADPLRYGPFTLGTSTHFNSPAPAAVWRDGVALSAPFDMAPMNVWHTYGLRTANPASVDAAGRAIGSLESTYYLAFSLSDLICSPANFTSGEQDQVWNFIAGRL